MTDLWTAVEQLVRSILVLGAALLVWAGQWSLLIAWLAWWLGAVNWRRVWPALAQGAWLPVVLLLVMSALVWSTIQPAGYQVLGVVPLSAFWWRLLIVACLAGLAFLCGWLQEILGWTPADVAVEPPADTGHHHHGDGHA